MDNCRPLFSLLSSVQFSWQVQSNFYDWIRTAGVWCQEATALPTEPQTLPKGTCYLIFGLPIVRKRSLFVNVSHLDLPALSPNIFQDKFNKIRLFSRRKKTSNFDWEVHRLANREIPTCPIYIFSTSLTLTCIGLTFGFKDASMRWNIKYLLT